MRTVDEDVVRLNGSRERPVIVVIDQQELLVRMYEAAVGCSRPDGMSPEQAADDLAAKCEPAIYRSFERLAAAASAYFGECLRSAGPETIQ